MTAHTDKPRVAALVPPALLTRSRERDRAWVQGLSPVALPPSRLGHPEVSMLPSPRPESGSADLLDPWSWGHTPSPSEPPLWH